jgi:hypothetical protein
MPDPPRYVFPLGTRELHMKPERIELAAESDEESASGSAAEAEPITQGALSGPRRNTGRRRPAVMPCLCK